MEKFKGIRYHGIVKCLHTFLVRDKQELWVVEHFDGRETPLRALMRDHPFEGSFPEQIIVAVLKQVLEAINHLHVNGVVWHDVRSKNICSRPDGTV